MTHTPHELVEEFPGKAELIQRLTAANAHFRRLAERYYEINRTVHRAESAVQPTDEFHETEMRKERMLLKDEIAGMIRSAEAAEAS